MIIDEKNEFEVEFRGAFESRYPYGDPERGTLEKFNQLLIDNYKSDEFCRRAMENIVLNYNREKNLIKSYEEITGRRG